MKKSKRLTLYITSIPYGRTLRVDAKQNVEGDIMVVLGDTANKEMEEKLWTRTTNRGRGHVFIPVRLDKALPLEGTRPTCIIHFRTDCLNPHLIDHCIHNNLPLIMAGGKNALTMLSPKMLEGNVTEANGLCIAAHHEILPTQEEDLNRLIDDLLSIAELVHSDKRWKLPPRIYHIDKARELLTAP